MNFDLSLMKNSRLKEDINLQFRAELFNILNHPNFDIPIGTNREVFTGAGARNATFGRVTNTANASRQIQFGLKLVF